MFKRIKVKPTSFIREGKLISRKGFSRKGLERSLKKDVLVSRPSELKNQATQWYFYTGDDEYLDSLENALKKKTTGTMRKLRNNETVLRSIKNLFAFRSLQNLEDILVKKNPGLALIGVNNSKGDLERIVALTRINGKLEVSFMASNPMKMIRGELEASTIPRFIKELKQRTNNETLYFQGIDNSVVRLYKKLGAVDSTSAPGYLEYRRYLNLSRF